MNNTASALTGTHGEKVALCDVSVSAVLRDLLSEVGVTQSYRNDEAVAIEAVYTFPLPLDAVLLELQVDIGGRVLNGTVQASADAEAAYEDALADGNAAVMLQTPEPGLYTMNVGNLLPGEQAKITFRYALLCRWTGELLRVSLPTTVAPRFGASPLLPHHAPEHSLSVENRFSLRMEICGSLCDAQFTCPSHAINLARSGDTAVITLEQAGAAMDRDFILVLKAPQTKRSFALADRDGEGLAALASFQPFFPGLRQPRALNLAIVIDCSGSMAGDSIEQARQALDGILDQLKTEDRITLIAFGTTTKALSEGLLPCSKANLARAKRFARQLDATMGGTQVGLALEAAHAAVGDAPDADIFLVTDGAVSNWERLAGGAKHYGHRIFTVGVGSSVTEAAVRGLAAATGGGCELVSPREDMAERVLRHFERVRSQRARRVVIHWPEGATDRAPAEAGAVFEGDTVFATARFEGPSIDGPVVLEVETERGEVFRQVLPIGQLPGPATGDGATTVARLAASARLKELDETAGRDTALRYRLVSAWTHWLVVAERAAGEQSPDLPVLRKVPQMLAAGWSGTGSVAGVHASPPPSNVMLSSASAAEARIVDDVAMPAFLRERRPPKDVVPKPFRRLVVLVKADPMRLAPEHAFRLLKEAGLGDEYAALFEHSRTLGVDPGAVAALVLSRLIGGPLGLYLHILFANEVEALHVYASDATQALEGLAQGAASLQRVAQRGPMRSILDQWHDTIETIERLARVRTLLEELDETVQRSVARAEEGALTR